jgi:alpha-methylacyl-CoA racemase
VSERNSATPEFRVYYADKFMNTTVLELASTVIAPFAGMILADLGCDVVRVDPPAKNRDQKMWIDSICRHKRSIIVDFQQPDSRDAFLGLLEVVDILIDPYRPGTFHRMCGMSADGLCKRYPRLIYARLTGYSRYDKKYARALGHENNFLAVSGALPAMQHAHSAARDGSKPINKVTTNYSANVGGGSMACVVGILAAVVHRNVTGKGQIVDASVQQGASYMASFPLQRRNGKPATEPQLSANDSPWSEVYRTSDKKYMMVCSVEDIFYDRLIRGLGLELISIPDRSDRHNWPKIRDILTKKFASQTQSYWRSIFDDVQACVSPVLDVDDAGVDIGHPLVHLSRTPSRPTNVLKDPLHIPELKPGEGAEEVLQSWLGSDNKLIVVDDAASRILTRVQEIGRQSKIKFKL